MDEEQRKKRQLGGYTRWLNEDADTVTKSDIMRAVRNGVEKGDFPTYREAVRNFINKQ
jgi:hypothetical protein